MDGVPRRPFTSVNSRFEEKRAFDVLHKWWELSEGRALSQIDVFSRVLALALDHPEANIPKELERFRRRKEK